MNLKKDIWLILAALALAGMILLPRSAYSASFEIPVIADVAAPVAVVPASLPSRPIPLITIDGPAVRLPAPTIAIPTLPGAVIRVAAYAAPAVAASPSTWAAARTAFAAAAGETTPSQAKLDNAFDNTKADAEKASGRDEAPVPLPKRKKRREPAHLTLPEYDLLTEIGVPR